MEYVINLTTVLYALKISVLSAPTKPISNYNTKRISNYNELDAWTTRLIGYVWISKAVIEIA